MFNYIATMFVGIAIRGVLMDSADYLPQSAKTDCNLPLLLLPTRFHLGFFIAVVIALLIWFVMYKTVLGYELKVSGSNPRGAFCVGIPVQKSLLTAAILSGGLSGIAGSVELLGVQHRLMENLSAGNGFTAILIALSCKEPPIGSHFGFNFVRRAASRCKYHATSNGYPVIYCQHFDWLYCFSDPIQGLLGTAHSREEKNGGE